MSNYTKSLFFCWLIVVVVGMGGMWLMKQAGWIGQADAVEQDMPPVSNPHRGGFQQ